MLETPDAFDDVGFGVISSVLNLLHRDLGCGFPKPWRFPVTNLLLEARHLGYLFVPSCSGLLVR
jgi:hypothetical protein